MTQKHKKPNGFVYVARVEGKNRTCKIGYTLSKPSKRVAELKRCYKGLSFTLFDFVESESPSQLESQAHMFLKDRNESREIFNVSPSSAMRVLRLVEGKRFSVVDQDNLMQFASSSMKVFSFCKKHPETAIKRINKFLFKFNIIGSSLLFKQDLVDEFETFVTEGCF